MATIKKDYLTELQAFAANGGKDINAFLAQHTPNVVQAATPDVVQAAVPATAVGTPAARIAAANSAARLLGQGAPVTGDVANNPALRPLTAESNALAARIAQRNSPNGVIVQPATLPPAAPAAPAGSFASTLTPRQIMPTVQDSASATAPTAPASETPWWQRTAQSVGSLDLRGFKEFGEQNNDQAAGRAARDNSFIRLNRNTFIPATQNYNRSSGL